MKMIMTVIAKRSAENVLNALVNAGYMATYSDTRGGMLRQSQISIFVAVEDESVDDVLKIVKANCTSRSQALNVSHSEEGETLTPSSDFMLGGSVTFVWDLDRLEKS
jgi:uncharacterized protein YaaQ